MLDHSLLQARQAQEQQDSAASLAGRLQTAGAQMQASTCAQLCFTLQWCLDQDH